MTFCSVCGVPHCERHRPLTEFEIEAIEAQIEGLLRMEAGLQQTIFGLRLKREELLNKLPPDKRAKWLSDHRGS